MATARKPTITLLTDYGTRDSYVACMKGVILNINPDVNIVDISHDIAPQDILEASFVLRSSYSYFPTRTIHVVVVDPTVGSPRKIVLVATDNYYFLAPDNGVMSLIYDAEPISTVIEVAAEHYYRTTEPSKTFHGRDIMAPVAAWMSKGNDISNFGDPIEDYVKMTLPKPKAGDGSLKGNVLHVDRFGNLITNISRTDYDAAREKAKGDVFKASLGKQEVSGLKEYYSQGQKGELIALFGSTDYLEFSQFQGSAAKTLGLARGAEVNVVLK